MQKKYKLIINFKDGRRTKAVGYLQGIERCLASWKWMDREVNNILNYTITEY